LRYASFWDITQRIEAISYRRFGTTYPSHFKGQEIQEENFLAGYRDPKIGQLECPETSVRKFNYMPHNI
jgi:hypothetical protein